MSFLIVCTSCEIKCSYIIQNMHGLIFKQIYLTHSWTLTGSTPLGQSGQGSKGKKSFSIHLRSQDPGPQHQL